MGEIVESTIKKIFKMIYDGKDLELIGISSNTDPEMVNEAGKTRKKVVYTMAIKQGKVLVPVTIQSSFSDDDIKRAISDQLLIYGVEI